MTLTGPDIGILQVHPARFCNLRCPHCYSSSGPEERGELPPTLLRRAIHDAATLGYNVLSISGGEPLLYTGLGELCREGRLRGMTVTLVTNGTVFTRRRVEELAASVDAVAISLDGAPERHNRIRGRADAFESMLKGLDMLRRASLRFAFVYTLTRDNLAELEWVADFAVEQGASMLQVHPVEEHGRAVGDARMQSLSPDELAFARLAAACLSEIHAGRLPIQFDAVDSQSLPATSASGLVSPLVIEDNGDVVPLRYGFPRSMAFGNLHRDTLLAMAAGWQARHAAHFQDLFSRTLRNMKSSPDRFANIYQLVADAAARDLVAIAR